MKNILIINDSCAHGKVGLNAIYPLIAATGHNVYKLETFLISNTFNFNHVQQFTPAKYFIDTLNSWTKEEIKFDYILVGLILEEKQINALITFLKKQDKATIILDPTFADHGKIYRSLDKSIVHNMSLLLPYASIIVPNYTEAQLLFPNDAKMEFLKEIKNKYQQKLIITSYPSTNNNCVYYDDLNDHGFINYLSYPGQYPGTGDLFVGFLTVYLLQNKKLEEAITFACQNISELIANYAQDIPLYNGLPIEKIILNNNFFK